MHIPFESFVLDLRVQSAWIINVGRVSVKKGGAALLPRRIRGLQIPSEHSIWLEARWIRGVQTPSEHSIWLEARRIRGLQIPSEHSIWLEARRPFAPALKELVIGPGAEHQGGDDGCCQQRGAGREHDAQRYGQRKDDGDGNRHW